MKDITILLEEAEKEWREELQRERPLWSDMPVTKKIKPHGKKLWDFSTDLRTINVSIYNTEELQTLFQEFIAKYWRGNSEELIRDTLHYLLYHEVYHPLEAPSSNDDNKTINQAIRRGLIKAESSLKPLEQLAKVKAADNIIKDFILDNRFYVDNLHGKYVQEDIIPIFDALELARNPTKTNMYTITRYLYGVLYGPQTVHSLFAEKAGSKGKQVAEQAFGALLNKPVQFSPTKKGLVARVASLFSKETSSQEVTSNYTKEVRVVFAGDDRYKGIERFIGVLAPYIQKNMPQRHEHGQEGQEDGGSGDGNQSEGNSDGSGSISDILQDLLEDMTSQEQQNFLDDLKQDLANGEKGKHFSLGTADSVKDWNISKEEINHLDLTVMHEFYKRNHPKITVKGTGTIGEQIDIGKRQHFVLTRRKVLDQEQVKSLNLSAIARFQQVTRLPMLIPLAHGQYILNEYTLKEQSLKDIIYVDKTLDVPDRVEFYIDSSGSMYNGSHSTDGGFNDGSKYDMLSCVLYGYIDALYQAGLKLKKQCKVRIHNVADSQVSSPEIDVSYFVKRAYPKVLKTIFQPENGYSVEDLNIHMPNDTLKRTYIVVTDGQLVIQGRTEREAKKMKELGRHPYTDVVLFEIGGTYSLGNALKNDPNIHYHKVHKKEEMLQHGLEVLLSK